VYATYYLPDDLRNSVTTDCWCKKVLCTSGRLISWWRKCI